jgi:hypothetical protein
MMRCEMPTIPLIRSDRVVLVAAVILLAACSLPQTYFRQSPRVTRVVEAYEFPHGYDYYFQGPTARPNALFGIKKGIEFIPGEYRPVDLSRVDMKQWVFAIRDTSSLRPEVYGNVLISNGDVIGIWYSDWVAPPVKTHADGRLQLYPPSGRLPEKRFWEMVR